MNTEIRLRAIEPEDLDILYKIENDMTLWKVGSGNVPYSRFALHQYVENCTNDIYVDKQMRLMIDNTEGVTVGIIDLIDFSPQHLRAEVGIIIMDAFRHYGYATAAVEKLIIYAREILHLHQLYSIIGVNNTASLSLFEKIGFVRRERLFDWLLVSRKYEDAYLLQYFL